MYRMLEECCPGNVVLDYESFFRIPRPERAQAIQRSLLAPVMPPPGKVVYGHFFPVKYLGGSRATAAEEVRLVTIVRDPIERLMSHYKYWSRLEQPNHYLWRKMKAQKWGFEDFAFSKEMQNFYQQYFEGVDLERFDFIGTLERPDFSTRECLRHLDIPVSPSVTSTHLNASPSSEVITLDPAIYQRLREWHAEDYRIYEYAASKFA